MNLWETNDTSLGLNMKSTSRIVSKVVKALGLYCIDDFNNIHSANEKIVVCRRKSEMKNFIKVIEDCDVTDLGFKGQWYNLLRGATKNSLFMEPLDRALGSKNWSDYFPSFSVQHLANSYFDHYPLKLKTKSAYKGFARKKKDRLHFEVYGPKTLCVRGFFYFVLKLI